MNKKKYYVMCPDTKEFWRGKGRGTTKDITQAVLYEKFNLDNVLFNKNALKFIAPEKIKAVK